MRMISLGSAQDSDHSVMIWPLAVNRRERKARGSALGFRFRPLRIGISHRKGNATRGRLWRRLIMLIFAGWLPHFICPSRGCLVLASEITRRIPTYRARGFPHIVSRASRSYFSVFEVSTSSRSFF
jgi:hypothetical protein